MPQSTLTLQDVLDQQHLSPVFQPIINLAEQTIFGYESLIRGPLGTSLYTADMLFTAVKSEQQRIDLELAAAREGIEQFFTRRGQGKLFINLSASVLVHYFLRSGKARFLAVLSQTRLPLSSIVIELTEHERITHFADLLKAVEILRGQGVEFALDDFGDGRSSLRLWSELRPEIVKIDRYFSKDIDTQAHKLQTFKALMHISDVFDTRLVAEGIETAEELEVIRDLGVVYAQGFFIGRPANEPNVPLSPISVEILGNRQVVVYPALRQVTRGRFSADRLTIQAPSARPDMRNDELVEIFQAHPSLHALAVVDDTGIPLGLINRRDFMDRYAHPYHKELFGRRPCTVFMDASPIMIDKHQGIEQLTTILTSDNQRYLSDGFIITDAGRYLGLGTGDQLVRAVTEVRIEAARHANPLTFLPGNLPISEHIDRLLATGGRFTACYCDLNHFKPYNDQYGYWRGDEMIRLVAGVISANCDPRRDFVGHVGGDDFVVLFQSDDWHVRCERIVHVFNERALSLFDAPALECGGIEAEDRHGNPSFFPLTTLTIGAVQIAPDTYQRAEDVASAAAAAKRAAKHSHAGVYVVGELVA
jgi:EAL domain-containing protein (putative c-di-GMP-specific phosphodiesterase class I)/GGDEF domain-containing protein